MLFQSLYECSLIVGQPASRVLFQLLYECSLIVGQPSVISIALRVLANSRPAECYFNCFTSAR